MRAITGGFWEWGLAQQSRWAPLVEAVQLEIHRALQDILDNVGGVGWVPGRKGLWIQEKPLVVPGWCRIPYQRVENPCCDGALRDPWFVDLALGTPPCDRPERQHFHPLALNLARFSEPQKFVLTADIECTCHLWGFARSKSNAGTKQTSDSLVRILCGSHFGWTINIQQDIWRDSRGTCALMTCPWDPMTVSGCVVIHSHCSLSKEGKGLRIRWEPRIRPRSWVMLLEPLVVGGWATSAAGEARFRGITWHVYSFVDLYIYDILWSSMRFVYAFLVYLHCKNYIYTCYTYTKFQV